MAHVAITVDVYYDSGTTPGSYRVYVDNELLTERTWSWPSYEVFIRENIHVNLAAGEHEVNIVKCQGPGHFTVRGFTVDGQPHSPDNLRFDIHS